MVEEVQVLVVGTGCSVCRAVLCDHQLVIAAHNPLIIDSRFLRMVEDGEWDLLKEVMEDVLRDWRVAEGRARAVNAELPKDKDILPFMVTTEGKYVAKEVYDRMKIIGGQDVR